MKSIFPVILFLLFLEPGFAQTRTVINVDTFSMRRYVKETFTSLMYRTGKLVQEGKIPAFRDKDLSKPISKKQMDTLGGITETVEMEDPISGKVSDTTVFSPFEPGRITSWVIYFDGKTEKAVGVSAERYQGDGIRSRLIYYLRFADVLTVLKPQEKRLYTNYRNYVNKVKPGSNNLVVDTGNLVNFISAWSQDLRVRLFDKIIKDGITSYQTDSLVWKMSAETVRRKGMICETRQYPDPLNPNDPYSMIDTTICTPIPNSDLKGFSASFDWTLEERSATVALHAAGVLYEPEIAGISLPAQPFGWNEPGALSAAVGQDNWAFLNDLFYSEMLTRIDRYYAR